MFDLAHFGLQHMIEAGKRLRRAAHGASTLEQAADQVVALLYDDFQLAGSGAPTCALVRCFITHPLGGLPPELRAIALSQIAPGDISADPASSAAVRCLTLLATRGLEPAWNATETSAGHRTIALPTRSIVERAPMIARLILQMGLQINQVIDPEPALLIDLERQSFNVFHVEDAVGSEFVPAQREFVIPYGVRSVLGFGGVLPSGELFVVVMFVKVKVSRETAQLFRTLALNVKLALLPFSGQQVFHNRGTGANESGS